MCLSRVNQEMQILYTLYAVNLLCLKPLFCVLDWLCIFGGNASFTTMAELALDFAAAHKRTHYLWRALYITRFTPTCDHVPLCQTFYPHLCFFPLVLARSMMLKSLRTNFSIHCYHHFLLRMQPLLPMSMPFAYAKLCSFWQEV